MALDADLLTQAREAEAVVIDREHDAEVARADFHRAVRRLQLAGGSLREIADALGLSHQRVHQIVEEAGGARPWRGGRWSALGREQDQLLRCSFCGRDKDHVSKLIAGPHVFICDECSVLASEVIETGEKHAAMASVAADDRAVKCSFCGKHRYQVRGLATGGEKAICAECLDLCHEILEESRP